VAETRERVDVRDNASLNEAFANTFSGESGEAVLKDLVENWFEPVAYHPGEGHSVNDTIFFEGTRYIVEYILFRIKGHTEPEAMGKKILQQEIGGNSYL
jgi:hypothetical protein